MSLPLPPADRQSRRATGAGTRIEAAGLWRVWHPGPYDRSATQLRTFGPLARFDPHPAGPPTDHGSNGRGAWYGSAGFATAVCERLARGRRAVDVCPGLRASFVQLDADTTVADLTDAVGCAPWGASPALGDSVDGDPYPTTQAWARHLCDQRDGIRYHSARHRTETGGRDGINVVVWRAGRLTVTLHQHRLIDDALWPHVLMALDAAEVAAALVDRCPRCP